MTWIESFAYAIHLIGWFYLATESWRSMLRRGYLESRNGAFPIFKMVFTIIISFFWPVCAALELLTRKVNHE